MKLLLTVLLRILFSDKFDFDEHVTSLWRKASQILNVRGRVTHCMNLAQRSLIINAFNFSQFGYCPLLWTFHSRELNSHIDNIHELTLALIWEKGSLILPPPPFYFSLNNLKSCNPVIFQHSVTFY